MEPAISWATREDLATAIGPDHLDRIIGRECTQAKKRPRVAGAKIAMGRLCDLNPGPRTSLDPNLGSKKVAVTTGRVSQANAQPMAPGGDITKEPRPISGGNY
jgi:hypothetical protein